MTIYKYYDNIIIINQEKFTFTTSKTFSVYFFFFSIFKTTLIKIVLDFSGKILHMYDKYWYFV